MREATEIEKIINELDDLAGRIRQQTRPFRDVGTTEINGFLFKAQERVLEARMWVEEVERISDG